MSTPLALITDNNQLNYQHLIKKFPWIVSKNQMTIISPDSDGVLCALFMSHYFNWKTVGFYDGKVMLLKNGVNYQDCVFLDMDIFRKEIKSIGHHMVCFDKDRLPSNWDNYENC